MPIEANSFDECFKNLIDGFTTYDQTVDIVSSWESIFKYAYKNELKYFDRFPNIPPKGLTPDFSVIFKGNYGLIFEVKRTFPQDENAFKKEIKQLLSYDSNLLLKTTDSGKRTTPKIHDIVIVVSAMDSHQILKRFNKYVKDSKEFNFKNNLIFIEYFYQTNRTSKYVFRKLIGENEKFRDTSLPKKKRLEYILEEKSESFKCYPKHFMKYKVNEILCNDKPPELYMAVYLWTKVFYNYLSNEQKIEWRRGNSQKIQTINLNIDKLLSNLNNKYISQGNVRRAWVTDTFGFLKDAGLASVINNKKVEVHFRNLTQMSGHKKYASEGEQEQEEIREYSRLIADQYCKNIIKEKKQIKIRKISSKKFKQKTLFNSA